MGRVDEIAQEIANSMKAIVADIEANVATTRNHYGAYMSLLIMFTDDASQRAMIAKALVLAGANEQGVTDALKAIS